MKCVVDTVKYCSVSTRLTSAQKILGENAELNARLKLAESIATQRTAELEALKKEAEQLRAERTHYCERVVLLEEELRWIKAQYFGSVSQKQDAATVNPDQPMLFNEAEVLTAIAAADEAHQQRTTPVKAQRKHIPVDARQSQALSAHSYRARSARGAEDLTKCPTPHPLERIGRELRECYPSEPYCLTGGPASLYHVLGAGNLLRTVKIWGSASPSENVWWAGPSPDAAAWGAKPDDGMAWPIAAPAGIRDLR